MLFVIDRGAIALLVVAGLFLLVACLCLTEVLSGSRLLARFKGSGHSLNSWEGSEEGRTPGAEMRRWLQWVLTFSAGARGLLLFAQVRSKQIAAYFAYLSTFQLRTTPSCVMLAPTSLH
jgi:hypothetical protein